MPDAKQAAPEYTSVAAKNQGGEGKFDAISQRFLGKEKTDSWKLTARWKLMT